MHWINNATFLTIFTLRWFICMSTIFIFWLLSKCTNTNNRNFKFRHLIRLITRCTYVSLQVYRITYINCPSSFVLTYSARCACVHTHRRKEISLYMNFLRLLKSSHSVKNSFKVTSHNSINTNVKGKPHW